MGPLAIVALLAGLAMLPTFLSDDEDDTETPESPEVDPEPASPTEPQKPTDTVDPLGPDEPALPEEPLETGARFTANETNVEIELGEDETRSLAVVYYEDTEDAADFFEVVEARFYLVPETTDWSSASWETQADIPGVENFDGNQFNYQLADFEAANGLELLGRVDLRSLEPVASAITPPDSGSFVLSSGNVYDTAPDALTITANAPVAGYFLSANTDGDELITFLPEDFVVTTNGVPQTLVTQDTTGTEGSDWLSADTDGITLSGAGGDDFLETQNASVTLNGEAGNDRLESLGPDALINGGEGDDNIRALSGAINGGPGNDTIDVSDQGTASGGIGDDILTNYSPGLSILYGNEGNDRFTIAGDGSEAYGGEGDDFVGVGAGATGFGEAGNDHLQLDSGSTGYGGEGDDLFTVWNQFRDEAGPATVFGGDGADTIEARVRNASRGEADSIYLSVADFDPTEDVLQVGVFQTDNRVDAVEIAPADDGSFTDVRVTYTSLFDQPSGTAVIRLEGVTGITADQIIILDR